MTEKEFFTKAGSIAYCKNYRELKKVYGLKAARLARRECRRYIVRLWFLRESAIILTLCENYEKVPNWTVSKIITSIFVRFAFLRKGIEKLVTKLQKTFILTN